MSANPLVTRELLFSYFTGQATVLQKQLIEKWVAESPLHEEYFYTCLHEWETQNLLFKADVESAITQFHDRFTDQATFLGESQAAQIPARKDKKTAGWKIVLVAASVLFLFLFGAWHVREEVLYKSYKTSYGEISQIRLRDGSQVVLNANSVLQVPRFGFGGRSRNVRLRGEAKFSVVHTPDDKRFVVMTDSVFQVEVLGTAFNLSARKSGTKVVLQEGRVKVLYKGKPSQPATTLIMAPGDLIKVDKRQKKLRVKRVQNPENYSAWRDGRFVFENTSLNEIKDLLHDNYGLTVVLDGTDVPTMSVSGSFQARSANELLQALSEILNIHIIRQDDQVLLVGKR
ncbi:FecR family protein [Pontibacter sp. SGAir0037]|uniref:FecR family protein n=1 Tax=Pontibacter sp. SGAir0037 TaxID=2571030 RepID=UPI0010CD3DCD|nr:FecR domain-containing protein [Pontibacter sp. SGAir0037]QCR24643.1 iron dicitrate transport regulator FecR [Pontibacter sp. SGAir0037]